MDLLFYWKQDFYYKDLENLSEEPSWNLHQNSKRILQANKGDIVWAFTKRKDGPYVLAMKLVVNQSGSSKKNPYGQYKLTGKPYLSVYYDTEKGRNVEPLIRNLEIATNAKFLGASFQGNNGVRELKPKQSQVISTFSNSLPILDIVSRLDQNRIDDQNTDIYIAQAKEGKKVSKHHLSIERNKQIIKKKKEHVKKTKGKLDCEVCGFNFEGFYGKRGKDFIEAHHKSPLGIMKKERVTKLEDLALVCSNCHRMIHNKKDWLTLKKLKSIIHSGK